jgi:polar amino acid transport system substrate-binding protein
MKLNCNIVFILLMPFFCVNAQTTNITCYSAIYAPYSYLNKGKPVGIDIDLINKIAERTNVSVSFEIIPWVRLKQSMLAGDIECAAAFLPSSEYENTMSYMKTPITTGEYSLFIEDKNKNNFHGLKDFYGFTIAINRGFKIPDSLNTAISKNLIKKYEVGNDRQSLEMLSKSRVKGVLKDKNVGLFNLKKYNIKNVTLIPEALTSTPVYLVLSKSLEENGLLEKFEKALIALKKEGTHQHIINMHLLSEPSLN